MKVNMPITDRECPVPKGQALVSKTDLKGIITYCNREFIEISGFSRDELLGRNHNMVRHPDMPSAVFEDLWKSLKSGRPWSGLVKNRCKNGDYYWVRANVTPITRNGTVVEYMSVRSHVGAEEIARAENYYKQVSDGKIRFSPDWESSRPSVIATIGVRNFFNLITWGGAAALLLIAFLAYRRVDEGLLFWLAGFLALGLVLLGTLFGRHLLRILAYTRDRMRDIAEGDYLGEIELDGRDDELGDMLTRLKSLQIRLGFEVMDSKARAEQAHRVTLALDNVSSALMLLDNDGKVEYQNRSAIQLMERMAGEVKKLHPDFDPQKSMDLDRLLPENSSLRGQLHAITGSRKESIEVGDMSVDLVVTAAADSSGARLGLALEWIDRTDAVQAEREVDQMVAAARRGDFDSRINLQGKQGFYLELAEGLNDLMQMVQRGFADVAASVQAIAKGDLTRPITNDYEGSFDRLKQDVNTTIQRLEELVAELRESAEQVAISSGEISSGNQQLSVRTEQQASGLEETASSMEEFTSSVQSNAESARQASDLSIQAREQAEVGGEVVRQMVQAMMDIRASADKINEIIGVVDEIAFQTNLLALNASVEAARAGDQGRGFAVVASEVRNLAGRSAAAAKEIKGLIQESASKVGNGVDLAESSGSTLKQIVDQVKQVSTLISEIAEASQEQAAGISQVNQAVVNMDEMTQQNAALAEETSAASATLAERAVKLRELIAFFSTSIAPSNSDAPLVRPGASASRKRSLETERVRPVTGETLVEDDWEEF